MPLSDNEQLQEIALVTQDKLSQVDKKFWYALGITIIAFIPAYYLFKFLFVTAMTQSYRGPEIIYTAVVKEPIQVVEKKIFKLPNNTYSGYVKLNNINLEWGVSAQTYTAEFKTYGGTSLTKFSRTTYILPAKEKIIVLPRFSADRPPDEIIFTLGETIFIHKPEIEFNPDLERITLNNNPGGLIVSAGIKNNTAFTLKHIDLPVVVFDNQNQVVAVNFTYINDVLSGETRTFQYSWPQAVAGATRAEISPEINIFDRNVFAIPESVSPIDDTPSNKQPNRR